MAVIVGGKRNRIVWPTAAVLSLLALAVIHTWPLAGRFWSALPYYHHPVSGHEITFLPQGDYLQLLYNLWLFKDALLGNIPSLSNPYEFAVGKEIWDPFNTQFLPLSAVFAVFAIPFGDVAGYNALVLLSYLASGWAGYHLAFYYTRSRTAGAIAGLALALFPYRAAQLLGGHPNGFVAFLLPLFVYSLERMLAERKARWGVVAGLSLASLGQLEHHLLLYSLVVGGLIVSWRLVNPLDAAPGPPAEQRLATHRVAAGEMFLLTAAGGLAGLGVGARANTSWIGVVLLAITAGVAVATAFRRVTCLMERGDERSDVWVRRAVMAGFLPIGLIGLYGAKIVWPNLRMGPWPVVVSAGGALMGLAGAAFVSRREIFDRLRGWVVQVPWAALIRASVPFLLLAGATLGWGWYLRNQNIEQSLAAGGRPLSQVAAYSPVLSDILNPRHPEAERFIYPGVVLVGLAGLGTWAFRRERKTVRLMAFLAVSAVVLSFGPNLEPHLPFYRWIYDYVPIFHYPRVAGRMIHVAAVLLAVLAGYGILSIERRLGVRAKWAVLAVIVAMAADFAPAKARGLAMVPGPSGIYETVRKELDEKDGTVLALPIWPGDTAWSSLYQYEVTRYRFRMLNGYDPGVSRRYIREVFMPLYPMDFGEIREEQADALRRFGVRYVVFHEEGYPRKVSPFPPKAALARLKRSPALRLVREEGPVTLFEVVPGAAISYVSAVETPVGVIFPAVSLPRDVGRVAVDPTSAGGKSVVSVADGKAGFLQFGPYAALPSGEYRVVFRLRRTGGAGLAQAEVSADEGKKELWKAEIPSSGRFEDVEAVIRLDSPTAIEFRVRTDGRSAVASDYVYIHPQGVKDPPVSIEAEDLFCLPGRVVRTADASNGEIVCADPADTASGEAVVSGPWRRLGPGRWRIGAWVAVGGPATEAPAVLRVLNAHNAETLASRPIQGGEPGSHRVDAEFDLLVPTVIEVRVDFRRLAPVRVDRLDFAPVAMR